MNRSLPSSIFALTGGGSWLATNVHGLTLAALNIYEAARHEPQPGS